MASHINTTAQTPGVKWGRKGGFTVGHSKTIVIDTTSNIVWKLRQEAASSVYKPESFTAQDITIEGGTVCKMRREGKKIQLFVYEPKKLGQKYSYWVGKEGNVKMTIEDVEPDAKENCRQDCGASCAIM